ncbi:MAG: hypothetical protein AAF429_12290 [Pseudomonadota bacterium]
MPEIDYVQLLSSKVLDALGKAHNFIEVYGPTISRFTIVLMSLTFLHFVIYVVTFDLFLATLMDFGMVARFVFGAVFFLSLIFALVRVLSFSFSNLLNSFAFSKNISGFVTTRLSIFPNEASKFTLNLMVSLCFFLGIYLGWSFFLLIVYLAISFSTIVALSIPGLIILNRKSHNVGKTFAKRLSELVKKTYDIRKTAVLILVLTAAISGHLRALEMQKRNLFLPTVEVNGQQQVLKDFRIEVTKDSEEISKLDDFEVVVFLTSRTGFFGKDPRTNRIYFIPWDSGVILSK